MTTPPSGILRPLNTELSQRDVDPDDVAKALLLMADIRGTGTLSADCKLACESLRMQLHGSHPITFSTVLRALRGLDVRLCAAVAS